MREVRVTPYYTIFELDEEEKELIELAFASTIPGAEVEIYLERINPKNPFFGKVIFPFILSYVGELTLIPKLIKMSAQQLSEEKEKILVLEFQPELRILEKKKQKNEETDINKALITPSLRFSFINYYASVKAFLQKKFDKIDRKESDLEIALEVIEDGLVLLAEDEAISRKSKFPVVSNENEKIVISPLKSLPWALNQVARIMKKSNLEFLTKLKKYLYQDYETKSEEVRERIKEAYERGLEENLNLRFVKHIEM